MIKKRKIYIIASGLIFFSISIAAALASYTGQLLPSSDIMKEWTAVPLSSSEHASLLDEPGCNTSDYVTSTVSMSFDSYRVDLSSIPDYSNISKIEILPCGAADNAVGSPATFGVFYLYNNTTSSISWYNNITDTTIDEFPTSTWNVDLDRFPGTSIGMGLLFDSGSAGIRVSKMRMHITHTQ